jgi:hypothetical protein
MSWKHGDYVVFTDRGSVVDVGRVIVSGRVQTTLEQWHSLESLRVKTDEVLRAASGEDIIAYLRRRQANLRRLVAIYAKTADDIDHEISKHQNGDAIGY